MIDDAMGASGLEGKGPGRIGGGPGAIHPKYDHGQAGAPPQDKPVNNPNQPVKDGEVFWPSDVYKLSKAEAKAYDKQTEYEVIVGAGKDKIPQVFSDDDGFVYEIPKKESSKSKAKMGHPDGSDEEGGPAPKDLDADDINKAQAGGILVSDPAFTQGGLEGRQLLGTKWPGLVIDYGYEGGKQPLSGGIKAGAEQVTDPAEPEAGKDAASKSSEKVGKSDKDAVLDEQDATE